MPDTEAVTRRVPLEYRWAGLDRRTFKFAIPVIVLALFWSFVVPAINKAVKYDDPTRPGDIMRIGRSMTFTPAAGWNVVEGFRTTDAPVSGSVGSTATLAEGGVTFSVTRAPFTGDVVALLRQVNELNASQQRKQGYRLGSNQATITTAQGMAGLVETFTTNGGDGIQAVFVTNGEGISVYAAGPPTELSTRLPEIQSMISSIASTDPGAGS
jgi:hypothetical protein